MLPDAILWNFLFIIGRFFGAMIICPVFSDERFSRTLKILLAMMFAIMVFPRVAATDYYNLVPVKAMLLVKEITIGALLGYVFSLPIWLIENVGNLIDVQRGEQFGAQVNQLTRNPSSSISKLITQGFTAYLVNLGGLLYFFKLIALSFLVLHPTHFELHYDQYFTGLVSIYGEYFKWMVILALPVLFAMLVLELVIGLFSSFVPQLNVTIISMPLKSVVALIMLVLYLGILYHVILTRFINEELLHVFKI